MSGFTFPSEVPDTDLVEQTYVAYGDPEYGNPKAQEAWEAQQRADFTAWLRQVQHEAWLEGARYAGPAIEEHESPYFPKEN